MNKAALKAKWSCYCDTDKLVDDTMALLTANKHYNTEHGVCTLLDTYFTNKEPLIKLFMTSKHYIGDMRIAVEEKFDRKLDGFRIQNHVRAMENELNLEQLLVFQNDDGKTLWDYMATGKKAISIDELPGSKEQKEKLGNMRSFNYCDFATCTSHAVYEDLSQYMSFFANHYQTTITHPTDDKLLKANMKTSRAFNAVCVHYGVDKFEGYNRLFAQYADLVTELKKKMHFIISLNPLDYLTMSNGVNWISCHNIKSGSYMGGCQSYMLDSVSIVTFVVENMNGNIHEIPKVYRQMYHYSDKMFVQSRLYPQGNDGATNLYDKFRGLVITEFSDLLHTQEKWNVEYNNWTGLLGSLGSHYRDYLYNPSCNLFYPSEKKPVINKRIMDIGHNSICVKCGKPHSNSARMNHRYDFECL